jgi:hypothetical protein
MKPCLSSPVALLEFEAALVIEADFDVRQCDGSRPGVVSRFPNPHRELGAIEKLNKRTASNPSDQEDSSARVHLGKLDGPAFEREDGAKLSLRVRSGRDRAARVLIPPDRLVQVLSRQFDFLNRVVLVLAGL